MKKYIADFFDISGSYELNQDTLKPKDKTKPELVIRQRKETAAGRSRYFLAVHKPDFKYISGLFDNPKNETVATKSYSLDFGSLYRLEFKPAANKLIAVIEKEKGVKGS